MSFSDEPATSSGGRKTLWLALLALVVIVASLRWFGGDSGSPVGVGAGGNATARLTVLNGSATVTRADGSPALTVPGGQAVVLDAGDAVRTAPGTSVRLSFGGANTLELAENGQLALLELRGGFLSSAPVIRVALLAGRASVALADIPLRAGAITLETSAVTVQGRGCSFTCDALAADRAHVAVRAGSANVSMGDQEVHLVEGQVLDAVLGQPLAPVTVATPAGALPTSTPSGGVPGFLDESNRTLFPQVRTPTRPGDLSPSATTRPLGAIDAATYVVQEGDTLYTIARRFGVSWEDLWDANPELQSPELLQVGQTLRLPH